MRYEVETLDPGPLIDRRNEQQSCSGLAKRGVESEGVLVNQSSHSESFEPPVPMAQNIEANEDGCSEAMTHRFQISYLTAI